MTYLDAKFLDNIYRGALDLPEKERSAYIVKRCKGNEEMRMRVTRLVTASATIDEEFERVMGESRHRLLRSFVDRTSDDAEDLSGQQIGAWRIDAPLARGGLATVYVAHRNDGQFQQKVAFKVLRRGLDTDDVISRFRSERQILSSLEHPAITQILDGGTLDDGRPFLVLEFVDGLTLTEHCDVNGVDVRGRVQMIIEVLEALHVAHKHLVVHRDIKPSNVMVSGQGRVTLLDFGIAKLLDPEAIPGASNLTRTGVALLTPGYGTPEQYSGNTVTTASDTYQVGALLYELLVGERPAGGAKRTEHTAAIVPSRAISGAARHKEVRGDLDAIVSKAMEVDPSMRYASANEMVADLERYLQGRPVHARPDKFAYRFYKLMRRKPWLLPATSVVFMLVAVYIFTLISHNREMRVEQERVKAAQSFMMDLLGSADPYGSNDRNRGKDILVVEALDIGVQRLLTEDYGGDATLSASLLSSIAGVYSGLDKHQKAIDTRLKLLMLERSLYGDVSRPVIRNLRELAHQYRVLGDYDTAEIYYTEQLAAAQQLLPPDDPELGVAESAFGLLQERRGNYEKSRTYTEAAVKKLRQTPRENSRELINAIVRLARLRGEVLSDQTLAMLVDAQTLADSEFGAESPMAALVRTQHAITLTTIGRIDEADRYFKSAIEIYEDRLGRDHGATLAALSRHAGMYFENGQYEKAELIQREVLDQYRTKYGSAHRGVAGSYQYLAETMVARGRISEAIPLYQSSYNSFLSVLGDNHLAVYEPLLLMSDAQLRSGEYSAAEATAGLAADKLAEVDAGEELTGRALCLARLARGAQALYTGHPVPDRLPGAVVPLAPDTDSCN